MMNPILQPIPWKQGPESYARLLRGQEGFVCLYSGAHSSYSYLACHPQERLRVYPHFFEHEKEGQVHSSSKDPFDVLNEWETKSIVTQPNSFFASGWIGYWSYEMGLRDHLPLKEIPSDFLLGVWGLYDPVLVFDASQKKAFIASWGIDTQGLPQKKIAEKKIAQTLSLLDQRCPSFTSNINPPLCFKSLIQKNEYLKAMDQILNYLNQGDVYQINYTYFFEALLKKDFSPFDFFWSRVKSVEAPFSVLFENKNQSILSFSPESYLTLVGQQAVTCPIKGTRPRSKNIFEDEKLKQELMTSSKDQSELLMIVDLERNDLGKVCEIGSVRVPSLSQIESHPYVHHLVARVEGKIKNNISHQQVVRALLPGGSITGAPKKRAMEIIQELERGPRGIYTGVFGFRDLSPYSVYNIMIRTLEVSDQKARFGVGGGIVAESDPQNEYEETITKAQLFLDPSFGE